MVTQKTFTVEDLVSLGSYPVQSTPESVGNPDRHEVKYTGQWEWGEKGRVKRIDLVRSAVDVRATRLVPYTPRTPYPCYLL